MSAEFEEFTRAASATTRAPAPVPDPFKTVAVLGGGPDARLLAALSLAADCDVTLFSAYGRELELMRASSGIALRGAGPLGSYAVDRDGPSVRLTAELDAAVAGAEVIFLTGPVHKQRTYAMVLADHLSDGQVLVVAPARTFGALETAWHLRLGGCDADVTVVEAQGLPYWFTAAGAGLTLTTAAPVAAACLPSADNSALARLAYILPNLSDAGSLLAASFADLSAVVDIPALLLGGAGLTPGGVAVPQGGVALPENDTFSALLGPEQRRLVKALAAERRAVAHAFGVRDLPGTDDWITNYAGAARGEGARAVPDTEGARHLLRDGVIGSLAPLVSAAKIADIAVPQTRALIALTQTILGADVATAGRRLHNMGLASPDAETLRRAVNALGQRGL